MAFASSMSWREALDVFDRLLPLDAPMREVELSSLRDSRPEIYAQVVTLIRADRDAREEGFLDDGGSELVSALPALSSGQMLGHYRIETKIGAGGMGEVWLACRADGLYEGQVAVKTLHAHLAQSALRERFAREGRLLAKLQHPHIARLLDAGVSPYGQLYLALEYVRGERLDRYCDEQKLTIEQRLRLMLSVCEAVSHAHANLIVHRDLKPSNILVTGTGDVKLLDFGIAKLINSDVGAAQTELTRVSGRALTPDYAAPEQVRGESLTVAADVYSLGVILYRLLSGVAPYGAPSMSAAQVEREVLETEPRPPSQAFASAPDAAKIAAQRSVTPNRLRERIAGDLDTIVMKATKKAPAERYASVLALADDLQRHLELRPVLAQADSLLYRARKFLRRNRLAVATCSAAGIAIIAGLWQAHTSRLEHRRQVAHWSELGAQELAQGATGRAAVALAHAYELGRDDMPLRVQLAQAMQSADALVQRVYTATAPVNRVTLSADGKLLATISGKSELGVWDVGSGKKLASLSLGAPFRQVFKPAFSADDRYLMAHGWRREGNQSYVAITLVDVNTGKSVASIQAAGSTEVDPHHSFDHDDRFVYVSQDRMSVHVVQLPQATEVLNLPFAARQRVATFSPDGSAILIGAQDGSLALFDARTGAKSRDFVGLHANVTAIGMSEDGKRVIAGSAGVAGAAIKVWDALTGEQQIAGGQQFTLNLVRFSRDGQRYISFADDGVRVWNANVGSVALAPSGPTDHGKWHALSPDGQFLAFTNLGPAAVLDVRSGRRLFDFDAHEGGALDSAFDGSGDLLATAGADGTAAVWRVAFRPLWRRELGHSTRGAERGDAAYDVSFSPDGSQFAATGSDGTVEIRKAGDASLLLALPPHSEGVYGALWSKDGSRLLTTGEDGVFRLFDPVRGKLISSISTERVLRGYEQALYSADGKRSLAIGEDLSQAPRLVDLGNGASRPLPALDSNSAIRFVKQGEQVVVGSKGHLRLFDSSTGAPLWDLALPRGDAAVGAVAVSADDAQILVAAKGRPMLLVDAQSGAIRRRLEFAFASPVETASFSPDGRAIALTDGAVDGYLWRLDESRPRLLIGHSAIVNEIGFSADGSEILTRSDDGTARLWSASTGEPIAIVAQHRAGLNSAELVPSGRLLATAGSDNTVALWDVHAEQRSPAEIGARLRCTIAWRIEGDALVPAAPDRDCASH
jgi:WD40 repeat protein/serine/threonine protein kinase